MARISEVPQGEPASRSRKRNTPDTKPQSGPPSSWLIVLIPLASIALGLYTHYTALHRGPRGNFAAIKGVSSAELRRRLGGPTTLFADHDDSWRLLYVLNLAFRDLCATAVGRGLFSAIISAAVPPLGALLIEGLKDGSSPLLGPVALTIIVSIGQIIMLACANNVLLVPLFAWASWSQVNGSPKTVRPLPSPPSGQVIFAATVMIISLLPFFATLLAPPEPGLPFFWASTAFQFFPAFWIPVWLLRKHPAKPARQLREPRLASARLYSLMAYMSVPMWWYALYNSAPPLWSAWRMGQGFPDDVSRLIFYDTIAICASFYAVVLLQAEVDLRAVQLGARRVHRARLFIEDIVFGSSGILLLGPGFGMGTYFARREILAEKARFGVLPDVGPLAGQSVQAATEELSEAKKAS